MARIKGILPTVAGSLLVKRTAIDWDLPLHVFICIADHFEPMHGGAPLVKQRDRVDRWLTEYPKMCDGIEDCQGSPPQHTFFYPAEEYTPEPIDRLASLCHAGFGDVEVHLHHDNDSPEHLSETLVEFAAKLSNKHGLLRRDDSGHLRYGFIHGNWALDNSRPDGRWCGVDNEISVLVETGCYADFTFPSAPSPTQPRTVNSIYYARGKAGSRKSHDTGIPAQLGVHAPSDHLLLIQGPLRFDWSRRKFGFLPRLENGDLHGGFPPTMGRFHQWLRAGVHVKDRPDWLFVKLHTHGAKEENANVLLGDSMKSFHQQLAMLRNQVPAFRYYYVTAWEMAQLVHQAEQGNAEPVLS